MADALSLAPAFNAPRARRVRRYLSWLALGPTLIIAAVFLVAPIIAMFMNSVTLVSDGSSQLSLGNYLKVITDSYYWEIMGRTLRVAGITTLATLVIGYPAALVLYFSAGISRRVFLFVVISPLFVAQVVRTYGWMIVLGPSGLINSVLPDKYQFTLLRTESAIVIGLTHILLPFMILAINATLYKVDRRLLVAAATLGASNLRIFRDILLPPTIPGIVSGCAIVFSISMTAFSIPVLLGGSRSKTITYLIFQENLLFANWQLGGTLAIILLVVTVVIVRLGSSISGRSKAEVAVA